MQTDLNSFNNSDYDPGTPVKRFLWYGSNIIFYKTSLPWPQFIKTYLLKLFGAKIGKNILIKPNVNIKYPWFLEIGNNSWIGEGVWIDNLASVIIGKNVCISQGALLLCGNHNYKRGSFDLITAPITLEDGSWIGAQSVVCPGITCKSHSILTVGSIATADLEAYSIYQGNPAQKIRDRKMEA